MASRFSQRTIKRLFSLTGNQCAFPKCNAPLIDSDSGALLGDVCHIKAKNPEGPRYDASQSDRDRHAFENLIVMCPSHHRVVDSDEASYTVERLRQIKAEHERGHVGEFELSESAARTVIANIGVVSDNSCVILAGDNSGQIAHHITNYTFAGLPRQALNFGGAVLECVFGSRPAHLTSAYYSWIGYARIRLWAERAETAIQEIEVHFSDRFEPQSLRYAGPARRDLTEDSWPTEILGAPNRILSIDSGELIPLRRKSEPLEGWIVFSVISNRDGEMNMLNPGPPPTSSRLVVRVHEVGGYSGWKLTTRFTTWEPLAVEDAPYERKLWGPVRFRPREKAEIEADNDW